MKIRDLPLKPMVRIEADALLSHAASEMRYGDVSSLAILDHGELTGIITERDMLKAVISRDDPAHITVRFYMTLRTRNSRRTRKFELR